MGEGKVGSRVENRKVFWWKILNLSSPLVKVRERERERELQTDIKVLKPETVTCWTFRFLLVTSDKSTNHLEEIWDFAGS